MKRHVLLRLLLSFVLLFSQQMATAHALEHLAGALDLAGQVAVDSDEASELAKAVAQHQNCHQCLAFAQLAGPLASSARSFVPPELVAYGALHPPRDVLSSRIVQARPPRGPPRL
jgi:hypothetical protein